MNSWPMHAVEERPWSQSVRGGTREDRMLRAVAVSIPPFIADEHFTAPPELSDLVSQATIAIARADGVARGSNHALSSFMVRSESIASSKIERIEASASDYARALAGGKGNASATSMVASGRALADLVTETAKSGSFSLDSITCAHRALMAEDQFEADYAGRFRDMQNWIGGSDYSPRNALYVPPPADMVEALLDDLVVYLNRTDEPALVQASIAHAQFESIHAFTDGNGRIGRALISAVLRRRGVTKHMILPLASALLARRDEYFAALTSYRRGNPDEIITLFARAAMVAAEESAHTLDSIAALPAEWRDLYSPRSGSTGARLLELFLDSPALASDEIERILAASASSVNTALADMADAGIVTEITGRKRNRVWVATDLMAELDALDQRIAAGLAHEQ